MSAPNGKRFATRAVHAGLEPDPHYRSIIPAIHQTSTFVQSAVGEVVDGYDYARAANPTRTALERALGELEGGEAAAFSSGLAGTHALISAVCRAGDHVLLPNDLYGGTYRLVEQVLTGWGLRYDLVDQTDLEALAAAVRPDTRLIWVETPTNPQLNVIDIEGVVARKCDALVAVDNTFATPVNQRPLELGADFVAHSTTKYLGGHSDTVGGAVVVVDETLHERVRFVQNAVGDAALLDADIVEVMEPPFPAVAATDPVREAVELLVGDRQALLVSEHGRAAGILTRADLLEALAR